MKAIQRRLKYAQVTFKPWVWGAGVGAVGTVGVNKDGEGNNDDEEAR
jgi:hypothetical protein